MTIYLREEEVGSDDGAIGFPNLGNCLALVLQTQRALYGFHVAGPHEEARTTLLGDLVHDHEATASFVHLYGTCHWQNRYPGDPNGWRQEMLSIAETLGYNGPISGFNIASWHSLNPFASPMFNRIRGQDFTYVEYRAVPGANRCELFFKRMDKVRTIAGAVPADVTVERIRRVPLSNGGYQRGPLLGGLGVLTADVRVTSRNQGELHRVPEPLLQSFERRSAA